MKYFSRMSRKLAHSTNILLTIVITQMMSTGGEVRQSVMMMMWLINQHKCSVLGGVCHQHKRLPFQARTIDQQKVDLSCRFQPVELTTQWFDIHISLMSTSARLAASAVITDQLLRSVLLMHHVVRHLVRSSTRYIGCLLKLG